MERIGIGVLQTVEVMPARIFQNGAGDPFHHRLTLFESLSLTSEDETCASGGPTADGEG
jgi:hypothetical protein